MTHTTDPPTVEIRLADLEHAAPAPPSRARRRHGTALAAAALTLLVAGGAAVGLLAPTPHEFQTVSYAGSDPFMAPVGADRPGMASLPGMGGTQPSDGSEIYAAFGDQPACDANSLLTNLRADPARAAVWGGVLGVAPERIPAFTQSLTPVVLRADTAVIDHGYRDGAFVATPAVLAAGTAVFVNSYGEPTVKCFSGNPLTQGTSDDPAVTVMAPAAAPIATLVVHDTVTGYPAHHPCRPGSGPNPTGHGGGGHPAPPKPPLTGTWNHDGSILRSDGTIQLPNGTIVVPPKRPEGATALPDGGYVVDGSFFNADGSPRVEITTGGMRITLDGRMVDGNGNPVALPEGVSLRRNHDGTVTVVTDGPDPGKDRVYVIGKDGTVGPVVEGTYDPRTGSVTDKDGKVRNPSGSERTETEIVGGGKLGPDGTNTAPATAREDEKSRHDPTAVDPAQTPDVTVADPVVPKEEEKPVEPVTEPETAVEPPADEASDPAEPAGTDEPTDEDTTGAAAGDAGSEVSDG